MVLIGRSYGLHAPYFFPEKTGKDYEPSRYLKILQPLREHFTVFSGMSHFHANTHFPEVGLMTGVHPDYMQAGNIHNSISLDQEVASHLEGPTRFSLSGARRRGPCRRRCCLEPPGRPYPAAAVSHSGVQTTVHSRYSRRGSP